MKFELKTAFAVVMVLAIATFVSAQTAQVGNLYVGTCDNALLNTQQDALSIYDATGTFLTTFHGPSQNACLTAMAFDVGDHLHVIGARFGTLSWNVLEFDNSGTLLSSAGPFNAPTGVTHDLQGNLYLAQGNIVRLDRTGHPVSTYAVAGGATSIDLAPDQRTMFYAATNGDVKSFDIITQTQGADIVPDAMARQVRVLPDASIMLDTQGAIQHWIPTCVGCIYKEKMTYQIPANADSFALDPDGLSFWTINTWFDRQHQMGNADVYRTNLKTGDPLGSFALQPLPNGRYYSTSIGVNGDGMGSAAIATPSLTFPMRAIGTISNAKKAVLTNIGVVQVVVTNLTISGDFAIKKNGCTKGVLAGGSCNISVTFTPTQVGTRTGTLKIFDNAGSSPQVVTLSGVGK
ncbi:MAG: hypothetical protein HY010_06315 [Acidobacteria bacterium]|nr:hypothetical protein [Acidobacteriota bacterium]